MELSRDRFTATISGGAERLAHLTSRYQERWGAAPTVAARAPGRAELIGNHTDHNNGCVIACAVHRDAVIVAGPSEDGMLHLESSGWDTPFVVDRNASADGDRNDTARLMRGVLEGLERQGTGAAPYRAVVASEVQPGSGISSSAAFEVALGGVHAALAGTRPDALAIARAGHHAENRHMHKPSGLMDQLASAAGGINVIDFGDSEHPTLRALDATRFEAAFALCVVHTGASHADLTEEYAAIPREMRAVAAELQSATLRTVDAERFRGEIAPIRRRCGDRAVLRALHFLQEQERVERCARAIDSAEWSAVVREIAASGRSSWQLLQNVAVPGEGASQPAALALALTDELLSRWGLPGACRIHGGGFAGTILALVPHQHLPEYHAAMEAIFGPGSVDRLAISRPGVVTTRLDR